MAKFKNVTGFNQAVIIKGKKTLVRNNEVLEAISSFVQEGFEKVSDDTPVTVGRSRIRKTASSETVKTLQEEIAKLKEMQGGDAEQFAELQQKLEQLEIENHKTDELTSIESRINELSEKALTFSGDAEQDLKELRDLVVTLEENVVELNDIIEKQGDAMSNQAAAIKKTREENATIMRRMEILKSAMQGMELQIDELAGYDEEVVIMDDEG